MQLVLKQNGTPHIVEKREKSNEKVDAINELDKAYRRESAGLFSILIFINWEIVSKNIHFSHAIKFAKN